MRLAQQPNIHAGASNFVDLIHDRPSLADEIAEGIVASIKFGNAARLDFRSIRVRAEIFETPAEPELPRQGALNLAARGLRQGPRPDQHDVAREQLMLFGDPLADQALDVAHVDPVALGALDLLNDD